MCIDDEPDQEERIIKLRQEIEKHGGEIIPLADIPADLEEQLLRQMLEAETAVPISLWDLLHHAGLEIPAPAQLDNNALAHKLKEIVDRMASIRTYLTNTNHLSDRELYARLYNDALHNKSPFLSMKCNYVIDCSDAGSNNARFDRDRFLPQPPLEEEHES